MIVIAVQREDILSLAGIKVDMLIITDLIGAAICGVVILIADTQGFSVYQ
jgi:hypothetical protein